MIDIQIFEEEHQAGQPLTFKILIGCASQAAHQPIDYDLVFTIQARCTADELDGSVDYLQGIFGYDQPCSCPPARSSAAFTRPWPPAENRSGASRLPLAVPDSSQP